MKRFTETEKWNDSWFFALPADCKLAWLYVIDQCDCSGVWDRNDVLANCRIGLEINWSDALRAFGERRVRALPNGKWHVVNFVNFQYGKLSENCIPHKGVIEKMKVNGLISTIPLGYPSPRVQDKDKEKEKENGRGTGGNQRDVGRSALASRRPTIEELLLHGAKIGLPDAETHKFFNFYESKGWVVGRTPMKSWQHAMANWKSNWQERNANHSKPNYANPRNANVVTSENNAQRIAAKVRSMQAPEAALPNPVAE